MAKTTTLNHLAIIPDGNRRWAKKHGLTAQKQIYQQGSDKTFQIIQAAFEYGLPYVTFWASSYANLADRSKAFASQMEQTYIQKFTELQTHPLIHDHQVKIEILGQWRELLKPETIQVFEETMAKTAHYNQRHLTILVGYDGRNERGAAVEAMLKDIQASIINLPPDAKSADRLLRSYTWTGYLPDVDLTIRTGAWADPHNSAGFLSLLTGETQYAYPQVLWPDFNPELLNKILDDYQARERRLGK